MGGATAWAAVLALVTCHAVSAVHRLPPPRPHDVDEDGPIPVGPLIGPLKLSHLPVPWLFPIDPADTVVTINVKEKNVQRNNTLTALAVAINTLELNTLLVNRLIVTSVAINTAQINVIRLNDVSFNVVVINEMFLNRIVLNGLFGNVVSINSMVLNDMFLNTVFVNFVRLQGLTLNGLSLNVVLVNCVFINTLIVNAIFMNVVFVNAVFINSVFANSIIANTVYVNVTLINRVLTGSIQLNVVRTNEFQMNVMSSGQLLANSITSGGKPVVRNPHTVTAELLTLLSHNAGAIRLDPLAGLTQRTGNTTDSANASPADTQREKEWWTTVPFDTRLHGSVAWNTTTNRYTAMSDGLYHVECVVLVSANALAPALLALDIERFDALQLHLTSNRMSLGVGRFTRDMSTALYDPMGNEHAAPSTLSLSLDVALRAKQTVEFRVLIPAHTPAPALDSAAQPFATDAAAGAADADTLAAVRLLWASTLNLVPSRATFAFLHPL